MGADAVACRVSGQTLYTHLSASNTNCATACTACSSGTASTTATTAANSGIDTAALMLAYANGVCPHMVWLDTAGAVEPSLDGFTLSNQVNAVGATAFGVGNAARQSANYAAGTAADNTLFLCPCPTASANTCPTCSCSDLGVPTSAPTAAPTTAPSAPPTSSSTITVTSSSDDSLSGGAIAGIVIGSIVGAALVIGAGVMIGSK